MELMPSLFLVLFLSSLLPGYMVELSPGAVVSGFLCVWLLVFLVVFSSALSLLFLPLRYMDQGGADAVRLCRLPLP